MSSVAEHLPCECADCIIFSALRCQCANCTIFYATMTYHDENLNRQAFLNWLDTVTALDWPPSNNYNDNNIAIHADDPPVPNPAPAVPSQQTTQTMTNENNTIMDTQAHTHAHTHTHIHTHKHTHKHTHIHTLKHTHTHTHTNTHKHTYSHTHTLPFSSDDYEKTIFLYKIDQNY